MKQELTSEQQQVFDRYFNTKNGQHFTKHKPHFFLAFIDFEVFRDNDTVLEVKVNDTCIAMWKKVEHLQITIL